MSKLKYVSQRLLLGTGSVSDTERQAINQFIDFWLSSIDPTTSDIQHQMELGQEAWSLMSREGLFILE